MRKARPIERQEGAMRNLSRRIRGAVGMGLVWAAAWFVAGLLVARVPGFFSDLPFALLFAPFGLVTGIFFFGILVVIERRRGLDRMSLSGFAVWGAVSGVLLAVLVAGLRGKPWGERSWCSVPCSPWRARAAQPVRWPWPDVLKGQPCPAPVAGPTEAELSEDDRQSLWR
jgi:hypothetical protein